MKAAVLDAERVLTYRDVPEPEPFGERPVRVRVGAVGVCGSDVLRFAKGKAYHYPLVLGHEFSAIVDEVPAGSRFAPGDRVVVFPCLPDRRDPLAKIGEWVLSTGYDYFGSRRDGGMQEVLWVPEDNLVPLPPGTLLTHAAVVEPAAVALHGMLKLVIPPHATALVIGAGAIGALAAQWLRIRGVDRVLVADVDARKRAIMAGLGFEVIDADAGDTVTTARELTAGRGVDCAVEATGIPLTLVQALTVAATMGQVVLLGDVSGDVTLPRELVSTVVRRELRILGTWNSKIMPPGHSDWEMVIARLGNGLEVAPLISHTPRLDEAPAVFADLADRRIWYNKVVFTVAEEAAAEAAEAAAAAAAREGVR
jgi:L-iditol 2-dehydrogenase/galactitol-1-phosphate 5-dehydrogenase